MRWLFGSIAAIMASTVGANPLEWGIIGFLVGDILTLSHRIEQLEYKLDDLSKCYPFKKATVHKESEPVPANPVVPQESPMADATEQSAPTSISPSEVTLKSRVSTKAQFTTTSVAIETPSQGQSATTLTTPPETSIPPSATVETPPQEQSTTTWSTPQTQKTTELSDLEKLIHFVWNWFTEGNAFVRIGIIILFVGVSFLLNLAMDHGYIPIQWRLFAVVVGAIALLILGWRLKENHRGYALLIQGAGVGLLYLTIFASYGLYHLLSATLTFLLLIVIVTLAATLAVLMDSVSLALFGTLGGFLAPILSSSGSNNYIGLFSFYLIFNAGIFAIAWFKAWRILNLVGFFFTFSVSTLWGTSHYTPELFSSVEPFLILFFLFYVGIALLYAIRRAISFKDYIDGTLIFGTPILAFGLQAAMVKDYEYGVAISAFILGLFYLALTIFFWKRSGEQLKFLTETLLSIGVIFVTLAIPFTIDGSMTSATWAIEGAGILWVGVRQEKVLQRIFALGLQFCAGITLLSDTTVTDTSAFFNGHFIGVIILGVCSGFSSWLLSRDFPSRRSLEKSSSPLLLAYSLVWLLLGFEYQIETHQLYESQINLLLSFTTVLIVLLTWLARCLSWTTANCAALNMMFPLLFVASITLNRFSHPSANYGLLFWSLAFIGYFWALKNASQIRQQSNLALHIFSGLFLSTLLFWEGFWQLLLAYTVFSLLLNNLAERYQWQHARTLALGLLPVMLFLSGSCLILASAHPFSLPDISMGLSWPFEIGYLLWPFAFVVLYWVFYQFDIKEVEIKLSPVFHGVGLLLLVLLITWEPAWHLSQWMDFSNAWFITLLPIPTIITLWLILYARFWPFNRHYNDYLDWTLGLLVCSLMVWSIWQLNFPAIAAPLPWLPIINPVELMQTVVLFTLILLIISLPEQRLPTSQKRHFYIFIGIFVFVWLNVSLLRTINHWVGSPWVHSALTQTSLSIFWTLTGLFLMIVAKNRQWHKLWITGATLLGIVVGKLFLLDFQAQDSLERIISFITVGLLLMLVGYFISPPKRNQK